MAAKRKRRPRRPASTRRKTKPVARGRTSASQQLRRIAENGRRAREEELSHLVPQHRFQDFHGRLEGQTQIQRGRRFPAKCPSSRQGERPRRNPPFAKSPSIAGRRIENVRLQEMKAVAGPQVLDVPHLAQVQIIDAPHFVAALDQGIAKMTADESGPARYQSSHGLTPRPHEAFRKARCPRFARICSSNGAGPGPC